MNSPAIGIIGGSGLYQIDGITDAKEIAVDTPFGAPSDLIVSGLLAGRQIYFLPRHGKGHRVLPQEINHRANIYALKSLGVAWIICVTAVGSLKEEYPPRHIVLPDQYFDRTTHREGHTFFGNGIVAHVGFSDPTSNELRNLLSKTLGEMNLPHTNGGIYVNMDGPAFSTRAESNVHRQLGFDVVGMTNLPEAKLAREAEIALATLAMVTDYDCWKIDEDPVSLTMVIGHLLANAEKAREILRRVIPLLPLEANGPEHCALDTAIVTPQSFWPEETSRKLERILYRFLQSK